ncbi:hypothetical protein PPL_10121 [Heterostelium album PN500]|uniref:Uncharacterized protein n=1 Tax=Heterostelium pallidum (strain ATCC 26659 / Pp 5 / PN500) TaxID=670386 RepID=D3BQD6_HETP5|nr:hypothetical protein PPL_10121 [Heterostelium album PN500]EFA76356.1 hypothetical protein PPL_10121 [Heterostelium album PN500]|eukprot:XP_020428488.1 hypothetical protein PPL_10121 [Heterostelium album PN500]
MFISSDTVIVYIYALRKYAIQCGIDDRLSKPALKQKLIDYLTQSQNNHEINNNNNNEILDTTPTYINKIEININNNNHNHNNNHNNNSFVNNNNNNNNFKEYQYSNYNESNYYNSHKSRDEKIKQLKQYIFNNNNNNNDDDGLVSLENNNHSNHFETQSSPPPPPPLSPPKKIKNNKRPAPTTDIILQHYDIYNEKQKQYQCKNCKSMLNGSNKSNLNKHIYRCLVWPNGNTITTTTTTTTITNNNNNNNNDKEEDQQSGPNFIEEQSDDFEEFEFPNKREKTEPFMTIDNCFLEFGDPILSNRLMKSNAVSTSCFIWSNARNESYLEISGNSLCFNESGPPEINRFTLSCIPFDSNNPNAPKEILDFLVQEVNAYGFKEKMFYTVSDIISSTELDLLKKQGGFNRLLSSQDCIVQSLQLVVESFLQEPDNEQIVERCQRRIQSFKNCYLSIYEKNEYKPRLKSASRWLSILKLLENTIEISEDINNTAALYINTDFEQQELDLSELSISDDESKAIKNIIDILQPFRNETLKLQSPNSNISDILPSYLLIRKQLLVHKSTTVPSSADSSTISKIIEDIESIYINHNNYIYFFSLDKELIQFGLKSRETLKLIAATLSKFSKFL